MASAGSSLMGIGTASGENRAAEAAKSAISSPLLESTVSGATGVLMNITGGPDMGLFEVNEAATIIRQAAHSDCNVIFGAVIDESVGDHIRVTVIATGFDGPKKTESRARARVDRQLASRAAVPHVRGTPESTVPSFGNRRAQRTRGGRRRRRARRAVVPARPVAGELIRSACACRRLGDG